MKIPEVQGIVSSILVDIIGPQKDPDWIDNTLTQLKINNPVIGGYLSKVEEKYGVHAVMTGLVVYGLIKSQMAADELEELFSKE